MAGADRTFDEGKPIRAGAIFEGIVVAHHRWGPEIAIEAAGISGIVDIINILDDRPFEGPADFPEIGAEVRGVVLGYTPNGQLRLSLRQKDLAAAAEAQDERVTGGTDESRHDPEHRLPEDFTSA